MHVYGDNELNRYQSDTRVGYVGPRHAYRRRLVCADALSGPRKARPSLNGYTTRSCAIPRETWVCHLNPTRFAFGGNLGMACVTR